jgi:hypothetical protein
MMDHGRGPSRLFRDFSENRQTGMEITRSPECSFSRGDSFTRLLVCRSSGCPQVVGDGGFYFGGPSSVFAVAKQYNLPIFVLLLDNTGWSAVKESTLRVFPEDEAKAAGLFQAGLMPDAGCRVCGDCPPCPQSPECGWSCDAPLCYRMLARLPEPLSTRNHAVRLTLSRHVSLLFKRCRHSRLDYRVGPIVASPFVRVLRTMMTLTCLAREGGRVSFARERTLQQPERRPVVSLQKPIGDARGFSPPEQCIRWTGLRNWSQRLPFSR